MPLFSAMCLTCPGNFPSLAHMSKRVLLPQALKCIREAKAQHDPAFRGSRFAIACHMSHAYLCNIEAGRKVPPEAVMNRLADALGVPIDAISYLTSLEASA